MSEEIDEELIDKAARELCILRQLPVSLIYKEELSNEIRRFMEIMIAISNAAEDK